MNLEALITEARRMADDKAATPLYDPDFMARTFTEAEREGCARGDLIFDDTSAFLTHTVTASMDPNISIDPRIIRVDYATYLHTGCTRAQVIHPASIGDIRKLDPGYSCTKNRPDRYVHITRNTLRLWPSPDANAGGTLRLSVYRYPLYALEGDHDEPEIEERWHVDLCHWVLHKAYLTKDADEGDAELSSKHLGLFEARFGVRRNDNATAARAQRERVPTKTRYGGIR